MVVSRENNVYFASYLCSIDNKVTVYQAVLGPVIPGVECVEVSHIHNKVLKHKEM
jgi:hypothetical protein